MDKKTLDALKNFATALEELVDSMEKKAKEEEDFGGLGGIFSGQQDINNTLVRISDKIDNIESSNKAMIKNQEKILNMTKDIKADNDSKNLFSFGSSNENKKGLKDGVGTILLIAGGVLAIGFAFKLIGTVDFVSVMALAIALPFIALAFIGISVAMKEYELGLKEIGLTAVALVVMATALAVSSWILHGITPIGMGEFFTAVAISSVFVVLSYAIAIVISALEDVNFKQVIMLPFVFVSMALAVTLSSYILSAAQPISPSLLFNLVLQSLALSVVAIALSIPMMLFDAFGLGITDVIKGGLMLVVVAATMMLSSFLINLGTYDNYPSLQWALGVGAALTVLSLPIIVMGFVAMTGIGLAAIALGGVAAIIVSTTVMVASHILDAGEYKKYPGIGWALGVGTSLVAFSSGMIVLGFTMLSGIGALALSAGADAILMVARSITDVSYILADGNYTGGPTKEWAEGVGLAIGAFAPVFATLQNANILSIFGGSGFSAEDYTDTIINISKSILIAADIFRKGPTNWGGHPTKEWAEGVGLAIGAFAPIFQVLQGNGVLDAIFGTTVTPEDMSNAIRLIAGSIMDTANLFAGDTGSYTGGPTKKWAEGVGASISAFSTVYSLVNDGFSILDALEGNAIIYMMVESMLGIAKIFQGNGETKPSWGGYPTTKWSKGVTSAIMGFGEIYDWIYDGINYDVGDIEDGNKVITKMAESILDVGRILAPLSNVQAPNPNIASDLAKNIKKWKDIIDIADNLNTGSLYSTSNNVKSLAIGVDMLAKALSNLNISLGSLQTNQLDALTNISGTLISFSVMDSDNFEDIMEIVEDKSQTLAELFGTAKENLDTSQSNSNFKFSDPSSWFGGSDSNIKTDTKKEAEVDKKTIDDLYNMLEEMNGQLSQISSNSSNLSNYVNELRANPDVKIK